MKKRHKMQWTVFFALLLLTSFPLGLTAEETSLGSPEPSLGASSDPVPADSSPEGVKIERTADGKYYLDFKGATLINVLSVISSLSGINFIAGKEVGERQVNMTLDNVSLEDALQSLKLGCNVNYDFIPGRNIYIFRASADAPEQPSLSTKVFKLNYIQASRVKDIETGGGSSSGSGSGSGSSSGSSSGGLVTLKVDDKEPSLEDSAIYKAVQKILSERGKVSVDSRSNSLVVTDSEDRLKMVEFAISQLDRPLDQVLINVLLVETFEDLDRALGVEWGDENGVFGTIRGAQQATTFPFYDGGVNGNASESLWTGLVKDGVPNITKQFNPTYSTGAITQDDTIGVRDFSSFQITVKAMEEAQKLKVLAKPKILVLDNHAAIIKIATDAAIGTTTSTQAGGAGTETNSTERSEIGTILRVIPLINTNDRVTMTVEPTFATLDASKISVNSSGETGDPTVRTARTTLMLNDGQTIALGGLLLSIQQNGNRKVPFFGNIPYVGKAFFTSNVKKIQDRELILFVTPYIIRNPAVLETPSVPDKRMLFDDEVAPFWKVKQKEWYKELKDGPEKERDYEQYFDVRKKLMNVALDTMSQGVAVAGTKTAADSEEKVS